MFRAVNNDKIGNLLALLARRIPDLGITKLSKLLFLIDERTVQETGVPVTWVNYEAWFMGPVPAELYFQVRHGEHVFDKGKEQSLDAYIDVQSSSINSYDGYKIVPKVEFCDDEFSDYEMDVIDQVINRYGHLSATDLVQITHSPESLWSRIVDKENLQPLFDAGLKRTFVNVNLHLDTFKDYRRIQAYLAAQDSMKQREIFYLKRNQLDQAE
jgi:uncharacterized phage-associated protein